MNLGGDTIQLITLKHSLCNSEGQTVMTQGQFAEDGLVDRRTFLSPCGPAGL